jgi:hypothetical protein
MTRRPGTKFIYAPEPGEKFTMLAHGVLLVIHDQRPPKLVWPDGRTSVISNGRAMLVLQHPDIFDEQLKAGPTDPAPR